MIPAQKSLWFLIFIAQTLLDGAASLNCALYRISRF